MIVDLTPQEVEHNGRARLFRNGLAVVVFALLEDFIKKRTGELLEVTTGPAIQFAQLPEPLRLACTSSAIKALSVQAEHRKRNGEDYVSYIQKVAQEVSSTGTPGFKLTDISFGHERSNLIADDIKHILKSFHINDAWTQIDALANRAGIGVLSLESAFRTLANWRHSAAHRADVNIGPVDLQNAYGHALGIAIAFDMLISRAARLIREGDAAHLANPTTQLHAGISLRFLRHNGTRWREFAEGKTRAVRVLDDYSTLSQQAISRSRTKHEVIITQNISGFPYQWHPTDGP